MERSIPAWPGNAAHTARARSLQGYPLIQFSLIKSPEDVESLEASAKNIHLADRVRHRQPFRMSVMQPALSETEWDHVLLEHASLMNKGDHFAHILAPTEPLFGKAIADTTPNYLLKTYGKLAAQLNGEAWIKYSDWMGEEIIRTLSRFQPEDSEEYQLQARLEDFLHEIQSTILLDLRERMKQANKKEYEILKIGDDAALREKEKVVIFCRTKILELLDAQKELLLLIYEGVGKIEELHPELIPIKNTALLMARLMTPGLSWNSRILSCQMLDQQLGVVTVISGLESDGRVALVYAIRAALEEISHRYPAGQVIELCLGWDEINRGERLPDELRLLVAEIAHARSRNGGSRLKAGEALSTDDVNGGWISFIPEKIAYKSNEFHGEIGLIVRDPVTGKSAGFTIEGYRLMRRWGIA